MRYVELALGHNVGFDPCTLLLDPREICRLPLVGRDRGAAVTDCEVRVESARDGEPFGVVL